MSSRNSYLDAGGRRKATALFRALQAGADLIQAGVHEPEKVRQKMRAVMLAEPGVEVDYAEVADPETLVPLESFGGRVVLLVAARVGTTRLIDNMIVPCA
jgi:pantothenate synthetase